MPVFWATKWMTSLVSDSFMDAKKIGIRQASRAVLLRGEHIDVPAPQRTSDGRGRVHIHVEPEAHLDDFSCRSRRCSGDSPNSSFHEATSRSRRKISCSK